MREAEDEEFSLLFFFFFVNTSSFKLITTWFPCNIVNEKSKKLFNQNNPLSKMNENGTTQDFYYYDDN